MNNVTECTRALEYSSGHFRFTDNLGSIQFKLKSILPLLCNFIPFDKDDFQANIALNIFRYRDNDSHILKINGAITHPRFLKEPFTILNFISQCTGWFPIMEEENTCPWFTSPCSQWVETPYGGTIVVTT